MKKIENFIAVAPKLESGKLEYCIWTDDDGALYVQIVRNLTKTENPGKHSNFLFRATDYLNDRNSKNTLGVMRGIDPETFVEKTSNENNDAGFVKAVLKHLFP